MHELSIAVSLVDAVCEELPRLGPRVVVKKVHVCIGPQSGVVAEALMFAFDIAAAETAIAGARLECEPADGRTLELRAVEVVDGAEDCGGPQEPPEEERSGGGGVA